jgi:hypothetical protein
VKGVTSIDHVLEEHRSGKYRVIGLFVATGYDQDAIAWLQSAWNNIHEDSGENWDLLVPVQGQSSLPQQPKDVDGVLGAQFRDWYRLLPEQTPCIIFDNFNGSSRQKLVSLKGSEGNRNAALYDIAEFMKRQDQHEGDSQKWLAERIDALYSHVQKGNLRRNAWHIAPHAFSLVAEAAMKAFMHHP